MKPRSERKQIHWALEPALIEQVQAFQHDRRLSTMTEAADRLLREILAQHGYPVVGDPS